MSAKSSTRPGDLPPFNWPPAPRPEVPGMEVVSMDEVIEQFVRTKRFARLIAAGTTGIGEKNAE